MNSRFKISVYSNRLAGDDIAQSANRESSRKKNPLSVEPFWERPTSVPPIRRENWRIHFKLLIFARKTIAIDPLLGEKPKRVTLPRETKYEEPTADPTEQFEQDHQRRSCQLRSQWKPKYQNLIGGAAYGAANERGRCAMKNASHSFTQVKEEKGDKN